MTGVFKFLCINLPEAWKEPLQAAFQIAGGEWIPAAALEQAERLLTSPGIDAVFAPVNGFDLPPLEIISWVHLRRPDMPVIIVAESASAELAENARQIGAADFIVLSNTTQADSSSTKTTIHKDHGDAFHSIITGEPLDRFDKLVSLSPAIIFTCEPGGDYQYTSVSENLQTITGFPISTYTDDAGFWRSRIHADDIPGVEDAFQEIHTRKRAGFDYRFRIRSGKYIWLHDEWRMMCDDQGAEIEIIGSTMDITSLKETQQELQSRLRFEELIITLITRFINAPADAVDTEIIKVLAALGHALHADKTYFNLVDDDLKQISQSYEWTTRQKGKGLSTLQGIKLAAFPWSIPRLAAGENLTIERVTDLPQEAQPERDLWLSLGLHAILAIPVFSQNKMIGFFGASSYRPNPHWDEVNLTTFSVVRDALANVWSRLKTESALRDREERFRLLAENSNDVICLHQIQTNRIEYISPSCIRLTGYTPEEMIGRMPKEFMPAEDWEINKTVFARMIESGLDASIYEYHFLHKTMGPVWVESTIQAIRDGDGQIKHFVSVTRDISERKRSEQQLLAVQSQLTLQVKELAWRAEELATLTEMGNMLQVSSQLDEACNVITQYAARLFPNTSGFIATLAGKTGDLEVRQKWRDPQMTHRRFRLNECWGIRRGRPTLKENPAIGLNCTHLDDPPSHPYLCIPVHTHSKPVALLHIQAEDDGALNENQMQLAATIAEQIGLGLTNLELRLSLTEQTRIDPLTGALSRAFLEEVFEQEFARACTTIQPLSLILMDIDHFREVNASMGHFEADQILRGVADQIHALMEKEDILGRFGGDEYLVLLPNTQLEAAYQRAERIRARVRGTMVLDARGTPRPLTVSVGVACWPTHGESPTALTRAVSMALAEAKKNRDQVALANLPNRPVI